LKAQDVFEPIPPKQKKPPVPETTNLQNKYVNDRRFHQPKQSDPTTNLLAETSTVTTEKKLSASAREFMPQRQTRPISTYRSYDRIPYSPTLGVVSPNVIAKPRVVYVPKKMLLGMPMTQRSSAQYAPMQLQRRYPPTPPPNHGLWQDGNWDRECGNPEDRAHYVDEKNRVPEKYEKYSWN